MDTLPTAEPEPSSEPEPNAEPEPEPESEPEPEPESEPEPEPEPECIQKSNEKLGAQLWTVVPATVGLTSSLLGV